LATTARRAVVDAGAATREAREAVTVKADMFASADVTRVRDDSW
jgi:hypothetical protein